MSWSDDTQFVTHTIERVIPRDGKVELRIDGSGVLIAKNENNHVVEVGDKARFYGKGFGFTVRGVVVFPQDGGEAKVLYYRTEEQDEADHKRWVEESRNKRKEEYAEHIESNNKRISKLPKEFQDRINGFRQNPEWGPEYEGYELFTCEEAVFLANYCKTIDGLKEFRELPFDKQVEAGLGDGHSGHTFSCACVLARLFIENPELVAKYHGAMCTLVGCKEYGCYASRPEVEVERNARAKLLIS